MRSSLDLPTRPNCFIALLIAGLRPVKDVLYCAQEFHNRYTRIIESKSCEALESSYSEGSISLNGETPDVRLVIMGPKLDEEYSKKVIYGDSIQERITDFFDRYKRRSIFCTPLSF